MAPAVEAVERLEVEYNPKDNFDHILTSDYEYKRWNTFAQGVAPHSIAFGIIGHFKNDLRAAMSVNAGRSGIPILTLQDNGDISG